MKLAKNMFKHAHGSKQNKVGQMFILAAKVKVSKKYILKTYAGKSS
jgi:hypothetical protein